MTIIRPIDYATVYIYPTGLDMLEKLFAAHENGTNVGEIIAGIKHF